MCEKTRNLHMLLGSLVKFYTIPGVILPIFVIHSVMQYSTQAKYSACPE